MKYWMFNCRKVTRMVSDSLDHKLPLYQRFGIRIHLMMCKFCSRYRDQLLLMRKIIGPKMMGKKETDLSIKLSSKARERIKRLMQNSGNEVP
jgi:hypothetical protein